MHFLTWHHAEPSLVLVAVVWYALRTDVRRAVLFGLIAGACEDILGGALTGAATGGGWTIATTGTALLVGSLSQGFFADSIPVLTAAVAIGTLLRRLIFWSVLSLEGYPRGYAGVQDVYKRQVINLRPSEPFSITKEEGVFVIAGDRVERLAAMTDFDSDEGLARFEQILAKMGVEKKLRELGAAEGDTVRIGDVYKRQGSGTS